MDDVKVKVVIPVKIDARLFPLGDHTVDGETATKLKEAGALAEEASSDEVVNELAASMTADEIDQLVASRAQTIAETIVGAAVERSVAELENQSREASDRAVLAETKLAEADRTIADLTASRDEALARLEAADKRLASDAERAGETIEKATALPAADVADAPKKGAKTPKG